MNTPHQYDHQGVCIHCHRHWTDGFIGMNAKHCEARATSQAAESPSDFDERR